MYVFTILCALLVFSLMLMTHIENHTEWNTLLTATIGGLMTLIGVVVNYEFGGAKNRDQANRAGDAPKPMAPSLTPGATP